MNFKTSSMSLNQPVTSQNQNRSRGYHVKSVEALSTDSAIKHCAPVIFLSSHTTEISTVNRTCVQAYVKFMRGEFISSSRESQYSSQLQAANVFTSVHRLLQTTSTRAVPSLKHTDTAYLLPSVPVWAISFKSKVTETSAEHVINTVLPNCSTMTGGANFRKLAKS